jgi:low affinity Fe/Cu permease
MQWTSRQCGRPATFAIVCAAIAVWAIAGWALHYSESWQLLINAANIVTFLMVFLIQHGQSRDTAAIQLKLDELIRVTQPARNEILNLEHLSEEELEGHRENLRKLASDDDAPPDAAR